MDNRGVRRSRKEEEEESYFVSMADMMVGLLFIFIILLVYFALQFRQTTETLTGAGETRREILRTLKTRLDRRLQPYDLQVQINTETGVLTLPDGILFDTARYDLREDGQRAVDIVADELATVLPCYTERKPGAPKCILRAPAANKIDSIFIEGHTDSVRMPPQGNLRDNLDLSALRATNTFRRMIDGHPELESLVSRSGSELVPILGVSGYGERRPNPDAKGSVEQVNAQNRRIDLRFLMATPQSPDGLQFSRSIEARRELP